MTDHTASLPDPLVDANLDDLLDSLGLSSRCGAWLRPLLRPAARRFARTVREFDNRVALDGLSAASSWLLERVTGGLEVAGQSCIPAFGPLLVLANHPGMADTAVLFASLSARRDLRVIALDRPFLRALPHAAGQIIFVGDDTASRTLALRACVRHLRQGGALLTFPAGTIEPDPAAHGVQLAVDALQSWSGSFALLVRAVPQTFMVAAVVSQVVSAHAVRHPLTRLRTDAIGRGRLAASLQILWPPYQRQPARVVFASVPGKAGSGQESGLQATVRASADALMRSVPAAR